MSTNAALDLQAAIYSLLIDDAALVALLGGPQIFDHVPQDTPFPYVTLTEIETRPWHTQTSIGSEHIITLNVWSDHHGRKQVHSIIAALDDALDNAGLSLTDHTLVSLHTIFWTALSDLDGKRYKGIVRFRAVTERN